MYLFTLLPLNLPRHSFTLLPGKYKSYTLLPEKTDKIIIYLHSHHPGMLLRPWNASTLLSWYLVANLPLNCSAHLLVLYFSENGCEICCLEHLTIRLVLSFNGFEICCLENVTLQSCQISSRLVTYAILF